MKIFKIFLLVTLPLFLSCKQSPKTPEFKAEEAAQELPNVEPIPPILVELLQFADTVLPEGADVHQFLAFKKVDANGNMSTIDMNEGIELYKGMTKRKKVDAFPIFEIKNADTAILLLSGKGFGGAIWAKVMIDKPTLTIQKIEFDHKAESDGYGAAMTQSTFENQFFGAAINLEENSFALKKNIEKRIDNGTPIDGISGATMTSEAALEMVNEGLKKYKGYLNPL